VTEVSNDGRLRLIFLLLILVGLAAYAVVQRPWTVHGAGAEAMAPSPSCPAEKVPALRTVGLEQLNRLREGIVAETVFGVDLHSYEKGFVGTAAACRADLTIR